MDDGDGWVRYSVVCVSRWIWCRGSSEGEEKRALSSANNSSDSHISQASPLMKHKHQGPNEETQTASFRGNMQDCIDLFTEMMSGLKAEDANVICMYQKDAMEWFKQRSNQLIENENICFNYKLVLF